MTDSPTEHAPARARGPGRHALLFIFVTVLLEMAGFGLIMPVMPGLIQGLTGADVGRAAELGGAMLFLYAGMQFLLAPVVGGLSDQYGRRRVLLLALGGYAIDYAIMGLAPHLWWLFVGRAIAGVFGASYSTATAYIADITPPEKRAQNFGMLGAAFGLGFILGPVVGGLLGHLDPRAPFFAAAILAAINLVYGYFALPETLPPEKRRAFDIRRANPVGSLLHLRLNPVVLGLLIASALFQVSNRIYPTIWSYFMIERFQWSAAQIGWSLGMVGLTSAVVQGGLTRKIVPAIGEARSAYLGLATAAFAMLGFAFCPSEWSVYAIIVISGLAGLSAPALQALMANRVPADSQGELAGAVACLNSLASIVTPATTLVFGAFTKPGAPIYFPGAPFVCGAGLSLLALTVTAWTLRRRAPRAADGRLGEQKTSPTT